METNNGKKGGLLKGKPHYDKKGKPMGGIKAVVTDSNQQVELEGGEVIINKEASKKHWKELSRINQSAGGGVPILPPDEDDGGDEFKSGGRTIEFNPNHLPNRWVYQYAKNIKEKYPKVWDMGGNIFGNEAFKNLERALKRGYWTENEKWMYIKWQSFNARHSGDIRIAGIIANLKWLNKVDKGWDYMKQLIDEEIDKKYGDENMAKGGKTKDNVGFLFSQGTLISKNKKLKLDYIKIGDNYEFSVYQGETNTNKNYTRTQFKKLYNDVMSYQRFINFLYNEGFIDDKMAKGGVVTYKNKYNKKYGYKPNESHTLDEISEDTGVSKKGVQQIYNKGIGAYKTNPQSVRPNVKSKEQWAMARVYSAVMGGKASRIDANELKMAKGGKTTEKDFFETTYGNLTEKQGQLITKSDWFDEDGRKKLQFGFDPYQDEPKTLFYYGWDKEESKLPYTIFEEKLKEFFEKNYNKKVEKVKVYYQGWDKKEIGTYKKGGELAKGIKVEKEHSKTAKKLYNRKITPEQAFEEIANVHLKEDSKYYSKLNNFESKMAKGGKVKNKDFEDYARALTSYKKDGGNPKYDYGFTQLFNGSKITARFIFRSNSTPTLINYEKDCREFGKENIDRLVNDVLNEMQIYARGGELAKGIKAEKEHSKTIQNIYNRKVSPHQAYRKIAEDHLKEDSHYYTKLAKMETKMAKGGTINRVDTIGLPSTNKKTWGLSYEVGEKVTIRIDQVEDPNANKPLEVKEVIRKFEYTTPDNPSGQVVVLENGDRWQPKDLQIAIVNKTEGLPSTDPRTWVVSYNVGDKVKIRKDMATANEDGVYTINKIVVEKSAKRPENPKGNIYKLSNGQPWEGKDIEPADSSVEVAQNNIKSNESTIGLPSTDPQTWSLKYNVGDRVKIRKNFATPNDDVYIIEDSYIDKNVPFWQNKTGTMYRLNNGEVWEGKDLEPADSSALRNYRHNLYKSVAVAPTITNAPQKLDIVDVIYGKIYLRIGTKKEAEPYQLWVGSSIVKYLFVIDFVDDFKVRIQYVKQRNFNSPTTQLSDIIIGDSNDIQYVLDYTKHIDLTDGVTLPYGRDYVQKFLDDGYWERWDLVEAQSPIGATTSMPQPTSSVSPRTTSKAQQQPIVQYDYKAGLNNFLSKQNWNLKSESLENLSKEIVTHFIKNTKSK